VVHSWSLPLTRALSVLLVLNFADKPSVGSLGGWLAAALSKLANSAQANVRTRQPAFPSKSHAVDTALDTMNSIVDPESDYNLQRRADQTERDEKHFQNQLRLVRLLQVLPSPHLAVCLCVPSSISTLCTVGTLC
jgi:hypothetical protein